jgi:hypothetical protein
VEVDARPLALEPRQLARDLLLEVEYSFPRSSTSTKRVVPAFVCNALI